MIFNLSFKQWNCLNDSGASEQLTNCDLLAEFCSVLYGLPNRFPTKLSAGNLIQQKEVETSRPESEPESLYRDLESS